LEMLTRKPMRLQGYDYSQNGAYFVTVCVKNHNLLLWANVGADIIRPHETPILSEYGMVVDEAINRIAVCYPCIKVDKYCIMSNHIHLLILMSLDDSGRIISAPTLSIIIGQMKRFVSKKIGFSFWQKSFFEHIIRNEKGYQKIWQYIDENPMKWELDEYYDGV